jgi:nitrite reductase/ring-hydroxylating ferredoxin subunit
VPGEFHELAPADEVGPGEIKGYELEGRRVALCNVGGELYAFDNICTHAFAILSEGSLEGDRVRCPLHGATFDVRTGEAKSLPAVKALPTHKVKVEDGTVYVALNPKRVKIGGRGRRTAGS